ncbi:hypothetical protein L2Y94_10460 [Luteibacter aegosomatis]|uniref:hypothetical protein n=1 Tax=Luteibacter aegosomatis TaxID=2911537 RepID=UPI001FFB69A1|nr:hypothetical protein [Luteibacter aegosomatis]UPG87750.1 hypothetical protein L2Y94_10460 [Luteibacter aegosomatis]
MMLVAPLMAARAQSVTPEDEYRKLIKVSEDIQPLGDTPFGEQISLYDGTLSFHQVDVTVPGTGPTISVGREFTFHAYNDRPDLQNLAFGDWDIDLPQIVTATANQNNVRGWAVKGTNSGAICSAFEAPPTVARPVGDSKRADWEPDTWWQGTQLHIPGAGSQEMLFRTSGTAPSVNGLSFPIVTKGDWSVGCLAQASNDTTHEGFLAVSPDGTKYWLDHLSYRYMPAMKRPLGSSSASAAVRTDARLTPLVSIDDSLVRREGRMLVTRIEDRFGNWVSYTYSGDLVTDIVASDGRHVAIAYQSGTPRVASVSVQGGASGVRTWTYGYALSSQNPMYQINTLTTVRQPDGSTWSLNLDPFNSAAVETVDSGSCNAIGIPVNASTAYTAQMTHPSGLTGTFRVAITKRGRSYVPQLCEAGPNIDPLPNVSGTWASLPDASYAVSLTQRQLSGAGIGTLTWNYAYSPPNDSWNQDCVGGCASTVWTKITYPDGHAERSTFSNRYDWTESLLQSEEVFDGDVDVSARRRLVQYGYVSPNPGVDGRASAYPTTVGNDDVNRMNRAQLLQRFPLGSRTTYVDSDAFTWNVQAFDSMARASQVQRYSSTGYGVVERTTFQDDYARSVLGLPSESDNLTTGETVSHNVYDTSSLTLSERYRFGRKVMGYTFNAQGQLATFTDGNNHTTGLSNYKRGIPQSIVYPDGTSQSIGVNDFGEVASITDQSGATTSYGYDAIGRVSSIGYPVGDSVAWAPKTFVYSYIGDARGLGGPHWMRLVTQGNWSQRTDYDALLRAKTLGTAEANSGAGYVSSRTDYDWAGRKTFQSYPVDGAPDINGMVLGVVTRYDALGRPIQQFQASESGDLLTSTSYPQGMARRVTDPKGNVTTSYFQAFDEPSYDSIVRVEAPEGVVQTITRDVYGNPLSIAQGAAGQSVTKTMTYDGEKRLCRTWEPESGSEIMAYDGADNLAWSVSGASFNAAGCGQDQVADAMKTVRGYDAMNRVTSVVYPSGTESSTFTYDSRGNPATATAGMVGWTFGRNRLGLLTSEILSVDGWSWGIGYVYDSKGALSSMTYPDGESVAYSPNGLRQPTQAGNYVHGVAYFADGDVKSYAMGNGALYSADKNARNLLHNFTYGISSPNVSEDFAYDANGNVSQITDQSGSAQRTKAMGYDGLNRLVSATAAQLWGTESYTYDTLNNILTLTNGSGTNTYSYDANNLLASISRAGAQVHAFQYDARGNTVGKDGQVMNFDFANRLTSISGKGTYTYDAAGRRVKKVTPQGTTYYAYNAAGQLMWEYDPTTTNGTDYIYLGKKLVADRKASTSTVVGQIEGLTGDNTALVGWACSSGWGPSIDVHLYVAGDASSGGTFVGAYHADVSSEAAVQQACHSSGTAHRFSIPLTDANRVQFVTQTLVVYGISPVGNANLTLGNSGVFRMPASSLAPPAPASLSTSVSADQSTITVSWPASSAATSYKVDRSYNGQAWVSVWQGAATAASLGGAVDGNYVFRVWACNDHACSAPTTSGAVHIAHIPAAPSAINVPVQSSGGVAASWPTTSFATSYQVEHTTDGNWATIYNGAGTSASFSEGRTANWYYRVKACNANGCGGYATSGAVSVVLPPTQVPSLFGGGTSNSGAYGLSWSGTGDATSYNLLESVNGGGWTAVQNNAAQSWSTSGRGNGSYAYMVQGCNRSGCAGWSNQVTVNVAHLPDVPPNADATTSGPSYKPMVHVTWGAANYATRYELNETNQQNQVTLVYSGTNLSWSAFRNYTGELRYNVRACNDVGCSAWSFTTEVDLISGGGRGP